MKEFFKGKIQDIVDGNRLPAMLDPNLIRQEIDSKGIRSFDHNIYSIMNRKYGLSCNDIKRFILPDNISSLAYGHYKKYHV